MIPTRMARPPLISATTTVPDEPLGDLIFGGDERGVDADAMRARLAARMFGVDSDPVRIGRFELLERLGAGGMGIVCAAFDPALGRKVALKILSPDRDGAADRSRLIEEAKTLARLSHPNVVTVHEVGELDEDIFIVMEYVQGTTLEHWHREDRSVRETLRVYVQAAAGLSAAHAVGVVHRDFKPANALLGTDGRVRVVDFGLARGDRGVAGGDPTVTSRGGTPAYMSPEQADGRPLDARSDQFSFCVALWEALAGERPYDAAAILSLGKSPTRRIDPNPERRRIPRWLRQTLLRGLSPDPSDRWPSMDALRLALTSGTKRRRQRIVGAVLVFGLGGVAIASQTAPPPCPTPEGRFVGVWDASTRAEVEQAMLQTELPFAEASWRSSAQRLDAYVARWKQAHVSQCVADRAQGGRDRARSRLVAACLDRRLDALGSVVELLSRGERDIVVAAATLTASLPPIADCSRERILLDGADELDPDRLAALTEVMGEIEHLRRLLSIGRVREAEANAKAVLDRAEALGDGPTLAAARLACGLLRQAKGEVADAEKELLAAALSAETDRSDRLAAEAWRSLVWLGVRDLEDVGRATTWAGLAEVALARMGNPPADRAELLVALGGLAELRGDHAQARDHYTQAFALQEDALEPGDVARATTLRHLANSFAALDDPQLALEHYERAREVITQVHGPGHPDTAMLDINVALTLLAIDIEAALERAESALATSTRVYGTDSLRVTKAQMLLAQIAFANGDWERGEQLGRAAWSIQQRELPGGHAERGMGLALVANATLQMGRWSEALEIHEILLEEFSEGPNRAQLPSLRQNVGWLLCQLDRCGEARPAFERVLVEAPHGSHLALQAEVGLAEVDLAQGLPELARERLARLLPAVETRGAPELLAEALHATARALVATDQDIDTALAHARRARELYQSLGHRPTLLAALDELITHLGG
jgi:eukaryotic-like serine/threonine-protein kinase